MKYNEVTGPQIIKERNFVIGGNYYFSIIVRNGITHICFPLCKNSSLFCFRVEGIFHENLFPATGWIRNHTINDHLEIVIPPYRPGFFVSSVKNPVVKSAFTKIFWEREVKVKSLKSPWSDFPVFYSTLGNSSPSIAIKRGNGGYYISVGDTPERALLNSVHLSRIGKENLLEETECFFERFTGYETDDLIYGNIMISIFYSNSRCTDLEEDCILASKSPFYYVSSAYWARDFIFWTLPVIKKFDPERAKSLIMMAIEKYWKNKGIHALYLDGRILYDGFELDQLSYHFLLLADALDLGVVDEDHSLKLADDLLLLAEKWRSGKYYIYATELNSSDDPVRYPYVTFDNIVLWYSLRSYAFSLKNIRKREKFLEICNRIRKDVMKMMVKEGMFVYSTDLEGNYEFYDDPTGSLLLLPYLGFMGRNSSVFKKTAKWIMSEENPFYIKGRFSGAGNRHALHPWVHYFSSVIISGLGDAHIFRNMPLDRGIICETVDENTGVCLTGLHFPGASGFFIQSVLEKGRGGKT